MASIAVPLCRSVVSGESIIHAPRTSRQPDHAN